MRQDYTHLVILLDRSGSMSACWGDTVGGINGLISDQKKLPGKMTMSLYTFNDTVTRPINFTDIKGLESSQYFGTPTGYTALNDAFCQAVDETGKNLANLAENDRPAKVLFVVVTDGVENRSTRFGITDVRNRLAEQKNQYNWNFMFMGADFDAQGQAVEYGEVKTSGINFGRKHAKSMFQNFSASVESYRCSTNNTYDTVALAAVQAASEQGDNH